MEDRKKKPQELGSRKANTINVVRKLDMEEKNQKVMEDLIAEMGWQGTGRDT